MKEFNLMKVAERPGVKEVLEKLLEVSRRVVKGERIYLHVELPTGYGKSITSMIAAHYLGSGEEFDLAEYAERIVHIVPTRYLVEDLVRGARKQGIEAHGQCMLFDPSLKDPFFLSNLVFTTFDSYVLNFYKVPIEEAKLIEGGFTRGHFDIPRYAILSAVNVFDEYHMWVPGDSESTESYASRAWTTFYVTANQLVSRYKVPLILETATPSPSALYALESRNLKPIRVILSMTKNDKTQSEAVVVQDEQFSSMLREARYDTKVAEGTLLDVVNKHLAELEKPLLIACNTIKEAVEIFRALKNTADCTLLHSQFTIRDRKRKLNILRKMLKKKANSIVVATSVIEVGVNLDFTTLITDAAPLTSLVQRVGRVNRNLENRISKILVVFDPSKRSEEGLYSNVYNYDLTQQTVFALKDAEKRGYEIGWRMTVLDKKIDESGRVIITVTALGEEVYSKITLKEDKELESTLKMLLNPLITSEEAIKALNSYGSLVRENVLVPVYVPEEELESGALTGFSYSRLVPCSATKLGLLGSEKRNAGRVLRTKNDMIQAIIESRDGLIVDYLEPNEVKRGLLTGIIRERGKIGFLRALIARPDAYSKEEGLRTW